VSHDDVIKAFNDLVKAWETLQSRREDLNEYKDTQEGPPLPQTYEFESLGALSEYHQKRRRYEHELEERERLYREAEKEFAERSETVMDILPEGYQTYHQYQNRDYTIKHAKGGFPGALNAVDVRPGRATEPI
jgi:hypothetical protein